MDGFNLNNDLYKDEELETLLNLKMPYNYEDVVRAKETLLTQLMTNKSLGFEKQREIRFFIDTISTRIMNKTNIKNKVIQQGSSFLIQDKNDDLVIKTMDGRISGQSNAPPGYLNPINVRTITQYLNIDTRFRPNYYGTTSTNFSITLPMIQKNVVKMRISAIEVPMTYYAISRSSGNTSCLIMDHNNDGWILNLPDGNYEQSWANQSTAAHIETAMNNAIAAAAPVTINQTNGNVTLKPLDSGAAYLNPLTDLCFTLDRVSGRSSFAIPNITPATTVLNKGFTIRFNVDYNGNLNLETNIQLTLGWQLGFRSGQYICAAGACLSEGICLICGPRYGFISIEDYQKNTSPSYIVAYADSILKNNIIARINLCSVQTDVGVYQVSNDLGLDTQLGRTREYFGGVDIQKLQIALYDEYGRVLNLNNMDWSFTLEFDKIYD